MPTTVTITPRVTWWRFNTADVSGYDGVHWETRTWRTDDGMGGENDYYPPLARPTFGSYAYATSERGVEASGVRTNMSAYVLVDIDAIKAAYGIRSVVSGLRFRVFGSTQTANPISGGGGTSFNTRPANGSVHYGTATPGTSMMLGTQSGYLPGVMMGHQYRRLRDISPDAPGYGSAIWSGAIHTLGPAEWVDVPVEGESYVILMPKVDDAEYLVSPATDPYYTRNEIGIYVEVDVTTYALGEIMPGEPGYDPPGTAAPDVSGTDPFNPGATVPAEPTPPECRSLLALVQEFSRLVKRAVRITGPASIEMVDPNEPLPTGFFVEESDELYHSTDHSLQSGADAVSYSSSDLELTAGAQLVRDDVRVLVSDWQIPNRLPAYGVGAAPVKRVTHTFTPRGYSADVEFHVPDVPDEMRRP